MAQTDAIDCSKYQGVIDWTTVAAPIALIKMGGGDDGLYTDPQANRNYYGAKAAGKAIGMYYFAGGNDPTNEADFFLSLCSPLEDDDVLILDWELDHHPDPVNWCRIFIQRLIDRGAPIPMLYMSSSRTFADRDPANNMRYLDWSPVVAQNVGLWVANYSVDTDADVAVKWFPTYVMHQYTDAGREPGVNGDVDMSVFFGSVLQFKHYGYHAVAVPATPVPNPLPVQLPGDAPVPLPEEPAVPVPQPEPVTPPAVIAPQPVPETPAVPGPATDPVPGPAPAPAPVAQEPTVVVKNSLMTIGLAIAALIAALLAWLHS
jgi:GH25 family lysozyme M1 (1,4-beta-N-acetylmuramidase)